MVAFLTVLTVAIAALVVAVLAYYLVAIVGSLRRSAGNLAQLAGTLEGVTNNTRPVPVRLETVRDTMQLLRHDLEATYNYLFKIVALLERLRVR